MADQGRGKAEGQVGIALHENGTQGISDMQQGGHSNLKVVLRNSTLWWNPSTPYLDDTPSYWSYAAPGTTAEYFLHFVCAK